jgi:hypothetical protein
MHKLALLTAQSAALAFGLLFCSPSVQADSLSCTSVNGVMRCTGSDGLDCHAVDGRMVCAPGAKGSCETVGEVTTCRNGSVTQTLKTGPSGPSKPDGQDEKQPRVERETRLGDRTGQRLSIRQDRHGQRLTIEQPGQELGIRSGDLDPDED